MAPADRTSDAQGAAADAMERASLSAKQDAGHDYGSAPTKGQPFNSQEAEEDKLLTGGSTDGRFPALDLQRVICIIMVCVDHGGTTFGEYNVMFVQSWVLQYLFLISGICFGMTSRPLPGFIARLCGYIFVGVGCNLTAWIILGKDWKHNMWNVVFQFWFIVALILFLMILNPLKGHLKRVRDTIRDSNLVQHGEHFFAPGTNLVLIALGFMAMTFLYMHVVIPLLQLLLSGPLYHAVDNCLGDAAEFWGLPTNEAQSEAFVETFFGYFHLSLSNLYIVLCFPMMFVTVSNIGWLVLLNTYTHKMVLYRAQEARMINGFDTAMLGLVCFYYGLHKRQVVGHYMCRYWFFALFFCATLWQPGKQGRLDEEPPTDLVTRMTYNLLELICLLLFLCCMERMFDPKIFTEDRMEWLGNWTLLLFLVHKAVHLLVPAPFNWVTLLILAVPSYYFTPHKKQKVDPADEAAAKTQSS